MSMFSQRRNKIMQTQTTLGSALAELDSLSLDRQKVDTLHESSVNPYYYRLFTRLSYYNSPIHRRLSSSADIFSSPLNLGVQRALSSADDALLGVYLSNPELVNGVVAPSAKKGQLPSQHTPRQTNVPVVSVSDLVPVKDNVVPDDNVQLDMVVQKPNFWTKGGSFSLHFTENYISDNWHKGGESTNTLLSSLMYEANYDNQQGFIFSNRIEMRLGFVSSKSDTIHKYKTNNDLIRLTSRLGLKAVNNWYYALSGEFNSQFMPGYKSNNRTMFSNFMAPANLIFSIGMEYKKKKNDLSVECNLSPLAYNFRYVGHKKVDVTSHGIEAGHHTLNDFGSKIQVNSKAPLMKNVTWNSLFYYFTDYKKIESYWENTVQFKINDNLSAQMFVHARFDDSQIGEVQLKQYMSFGITHNL